MEPRNRCQGINSASLCSMAGRYDNPIPTRCLAPIDFLKIPAPESCQRCAITGELSAVRYSREVVRGAPFPEKMSAVRHFLGSCQRCAISQEVVSGAPFPGKLSAVLYFPGNCQRCAISREVVSGAPFFVRLSAMLHLPEMFSAVRHFTASCQRCAILGEVVSGAAFPGHDTQALFQ